jgi:hypothetical protein
MEMPVSKPVETELPLTELEEKAKDEEQVSELANQLGEAVDAEILFGNTTEKSEAERAQEFLKLLMVAGVNIEDV